ncbi:MAG: globin family protein [Pseudomonadota bacterium]
MTPEQIDLVQGSFSKVAPISDVAAKLFYGRLFEIAPEVKPLFSGDMDEQGTKLMKTLAYVIGGLKDLPSILPAAQDLAARHVVYGVTPAMYQPVGEALLWTLEQGLEDAFTPDVKAAWVEAYTLLSTAMVESAYEKTDLDAGGAVA